MSLYLQRLRVSVRTKNELFSGTNSRVVLHYLVEDDHQHPSLEPGDYRLDLDHPFHDDFQRGAIDTYDLELGEGSSGREHGGVPIPNGLVLRDFDHLREMKFRLEIEGSDRWVFDRFVLAGYFKELRQVEGSMSEVEVHDLGWLEMARINDEQSMSRDEKEGISELVIELNGSMS